MRSRRSWRRFRNKATERIWEKTGEVSALSCQVSSRTLRIAHPRPRKPIYREWVSCVQKGIKRKPTHRVGFRARHVLKKKIIKEIWKWKKNQTILGLDTDGPTLPNPCPCRVARPPPLSCLRCRSGRPCRVVARWWCLIGYELIEKGVLELKNYCEGEVGCFKERWERERARASNPGHPFWNTRSGCMTFRQNPDPIMTRKWASISQLFGLIYRLISFRTAQTLISQQYF